MSEKKNQENINYQATTIALCNLQPEEILHITATFPGLPFLIKKTVFSDAIFEEIIQKNIEAALLPSKNLSYPLPEGIEIFSLFSKGIALISHQQNHTLKATFINSSSMSEVDLTHIPGDIRQSYGKVWLVGFGPGDPDLLTVKAVKLLNCCDIIFHDDLLDKEFINQFKAAKIYVGKRKGYHSYEQDAINKHLYKAAISGKTVVRLKGGDPMLFAHGGEEIEYLQRHFIETEVVPGITAALAAAALTKLPLTHRGISSSVSFITGHAHKQMNMPVCGTMVYYMSASNLNNIAAQALKKGWKTDTPVMLAYNISGKDQEFTYTTLGEIQETQKTYYTPLVIVIGNVVRLKNNPSEKIMKPTFLVTGTNADPFTRFGDVIHTPYIELSPIKELSEASIIISNIHQFQWIIFTSRHAVKFFKHVLSQLNHDARSLSGIKVASIGNTTSAELRRNGIIPDLQSTLESSEGLVDLFTQNYATSEHVLIPSSDIALETLPQGLVRAGYKVTTLTVYTNKIPANLIPISLLKIDYIVFSSPSCVDNFFKMHSTVPDTVLFIVQGKETHKRLSEYAVNQNNIKRSDYLNSLPTY